MANEAEHKRAREKRTAALARLELNWKTEPRKSPAGVTSAPIKAEDPAVRRMIDEALKKRRLALIICERCGEDLCVVLRCPNCEGVP